MTGHASKFGDRLVGEIPHFTGFKALVCDLKLRMIFGPYGLSDVYEPLEDQKQLVCEKRLGGVLKDYERLAA